MITDQELAGAVARCAVNYGRTFEGDDAVMALVVTWKEQLHDFEPRDLQLALQGLFADPHVVRFPTVADVRRRCVLAAQDRRREAIGARDCRRCDGTGWVELGTDPEGRYFVDRCPEGCTPPPAGAVFRAEEAGPASGQQELLMDKARFRAAVEAAGQALLDGAERKVQLAKLGPRP